jgi:hypothetical protein
MIKNITLLLATLILASVSSWMFFPIGVGVLIINTFILYYFLRAES